MGKKTTRWPIWKIALATLGCAGGSVALFVLSMFMGRVGASDADATDTPQLLTLPAFMMIMGVAASMLPVLCIVWLVARIREARTPPWERGRKSRRR